LRDLQGRATIIKGRETGVAQSKQGGNA
jgi:hypothetical protein